MPRQHKKYDPLVTPQLIKWMRRCGLTHEQIAEELGVAERTVERWANAYPEVRAALDECEIYLSSLVEDSLYKRAVGYEYVETVEEIDADKVRTKRYIKHQPPEVSAIVFWLKNRLRGRWRNSDNLSQNDIGKLDQIVRAISEAREAAGCQPQSDEDEVDEE